MSTSEKPSKGQQVYEKVEAMVAQGVSKAEAFRQLSETDYAGQSADSLRGSYHGHLRKQAGDGGPRRTRRRETTPVDAVADAVASLKRSIASIERELEAAASRALEAQAEWESQRDSSEVRIAEIRDAILKLDPMALNEPEESAAAGNEPDAETPEQPTTSKRSRARKEADS